jgi:AraC-like DNA-binding protein
MGTWSMSPDGTTARAPPDGGPAILAAAATGIVDFIDRQGGDIDSIFGNSGISPAMAGSTTLRLRLDGFCRLFEQAAALTRHETFGLWFGNQFQPRDLGLWGYAAISAPTLGSALEQLVDLFAHHQESSTLRLAHDRDGLVRLEYRIEDPAIFERRQDAELSLGMFLNVVRECCGPAWAPEEVHFEHPRPAVRGEHEKAFGAPVLFSRPTNALVFRPDILDWPMPARDTRLMALMRRCLKELSAGDPRPRRPIDAASAAIRTHLATGYPLLDRVSHDIGMTSAALQRHLAGEGIQYRDLVETVRRDMAMAYLRQRHLPLTEIAFLLGYSELSAFSRAVRRWAGASPRQVRQGIFQA